MEHHDQAKTAKKTALVTGGSRGIGRGIALALAQAGYEIMITHYRDDAMAEQTAEEIEKLSGRACVVREGDLTEADEAVETAAEAVRTMGQIDCLINNAGVGMYASITELPLEHLDYTMRLNFRAPMLLMREVSKHMIAAGRGGNIVNILSTHAERAYPGDAVYGGIKAALKRAAESVALDLSPYRIRVNCIAPGGILVRDPEPSVDQMGSLVPSRPDRHAGGYRPGGALACLRAGFLYYGNHDPDRRGTDPAGHAGGRKKLVGISESGTFPGQLTSSVHEKTAVSRFGGLPFGASRNRTRVHCLGNAMSGALGMRRLIWSKIRRETVIVRG